MRRTEQLAKALIEWALPGAVMTFRPSQAAGEHDFDLALPGGPTVPLEVTTAADPRRIELLAALTDKSRGGDSIAAPQCRFAWWVWVGGHARIDRIRQDLPTELSQLEADGWTKFSGEEVDQHPTIARLHDVLKIEHAEIWNGEAGTIFLTLVGEMTWASGTELNAAVSAEAMKTDNRQKLGQVASSERHLFVYVEGSVVSAWVALTEPDPPMSAPDIPDEVTHTWAAGHSGRHGGFRLLLAQRDHPWRDFGVMAGTP